MRIRKILNAYIGVLGVIFIGAIVTMFLVFPRVINVLADTFGQMGTPLDTGQAVLHGAIAVVIDLILAYFFVWRPVRKLRETLDAPGLLVRRGEGNAYIDPDSVRQRILNAISKVSDIQHADVSVVNDGGRALIQLNIVTSVEINGPRKKNEINREVRKVVQDQLGVQISGKPTINFTLAGAAGGAPQLASRASAASVPPVAPPSRVITPSPSVDEDEVQTIHAREDAHVSDVEPRLSGIELARRDAMKYGSSAPVTREEVKPAEPPSASTPSGEPTSSDASANSGQASADG